MAANGGVVPLNISNDYYASLSASGVGTWKHLNPTPLPVDGGSCTIANATIYCIGGSAAALAIGGISNYTSFNQTYNTTAYLSDLYTNQSSAAFYASIASNGQVGNWIYTAPYPTVLQNSGCTSNGADLYCVGGSYTNSTQEVFYSGLSPTFGIEGWLQTSPYPVPFYSNYCSTKRRLLE